MTRPEPLNYAILRLFLGDDVELDVATVAERLAPVYGQYRQFRPALLTEAVMTAEANGLLEVADVRLHAAGEPRIAYRATADGTALIQRLIGRTAV